MLDQFSRTELLLGKEAMEQLKNARIAVFGVGGVGGYVVEALARCGVGTLDLIDADQVNLTNLNRQIIATYDAIGKDKVDVMKERILSINSDAVVYARKCFFLPENADEFNFTEYDYVVDAVDTVTAKIEIIQKAQEADIPVISCMGVGNKLNPLMLQVTDIYKTTMCPLAKVMRRELKKRGVKKCKVLFSTEKPIKQTMEQIAASKEAEKDCEKRAIPGSISFVPSVAGLVIASEVIKDLTGIDNK